MALFRFRLAQWQICARALPCWNRNHLLEPIVLHIVLKTLCRKKSGKRVLESPEQHIDPKLSLIIDAIFLRNEKVIKPKYCRLHNQPLLSTAIAALIC
jgi:hypothetical protein